MTLNKKLFLAIWLASSLSALAVLPFAFELQKSLLQNVPFSLPMLILLSGLQSAVLFAIVTALGLFFARRVGFKMPILENLLSHSDTRIEWKHFIVLPVILGIITTIVIAFGDWFFTSMGVVINVADTASSIPIWKKFLASFYGGIGEEVLMRLFFVSMFVWLFAKITKNSSSLTRNGLVWTAIVIAAVLFGIGHLPATSAITELTPLVIARGVVLNGIAGLVFGWLYWKRGMESAVIAHFTGDIMILIVLPIILS